MSFKTLTAVRLAALLALGGLAMLASPAAADQLYAGAGRADITPPTGYYMMGWVVADGLITGQNTRLYARAIVLREGSRKVALVAEDLNGIPGGVVSDAAKLLANRGFSESNILDSASHTHAGPTSFYPFSTYDGVVPTANHPTGLHSGVDAQLYSFEVHQLAAAIARADADQAPAVAGWGHTQLLGLTQNRSIEAHLADYGIVLARGQGSPADDPFGYANTIDPNVDVLRVDKLKAGRHVPIGVWSQFADHGTVNKVTFPYYNADHHGTATRLVESQLQAAAARVLAAPARCRGKRSQRRCTAVAPSPSSQEIVNVYGNSDEGDISAGLTRTGPAEADFVGATEAASFLEAWRAAGATLSSHPTLDWRWTRICFCGQQVQGGSVDSSPQFGLPSSTGSEEGRGPIADTSSQNFEGDRLPVDAGAQGDKIVTPEGSTGSLPHAGPLTALRIGDRMIVSIPGEMTEEMGKRVRSAVLAAVGRSAGVSEVVLSGLANEYMSYFTTPEEYALQHYEGGSTLFGKYSSNLIEQSLADLADRLAHGQPAADPYPYDPTNGQAQDSTPFSEGTPNGAVITQPVPSVERLQRADISWQGAPRGFDRPVGRAFVSVSRSVTQRVLLVGRHARRRIVTRTGWVAVDSDLGTDFLWTVDDNGVYAAHWQVPLDAPAGTYRFEITANRYLLHSTPFTVTVSHALTPAAAANAATGRAAITLGYPAPVINQDLTTRPVSADGGSVAFTVGGQRVQVHQARGTSFSVAAPGGQTVTIAAGAATDSFGNTNAQPFTLR